MGSGTTVLTGNSNYTGGTLISAGALQLGAGGATGSISGNVTNNGALVFNRGDTTPLAASSAALAASRSRAAARRC